MADDVPPWEAQFVIDAPPVEPEMHDSWDLYRPAGVIPFPAPLVVLVHGGPLPADLPGMPRSWPVYRGYASLLVDAGVNALVVEHPLRSLAHYGAANAAVMAAISAARADSHVDRARIAVWLFSGGGPMAAKWIAASPSWLRCLALTYPILDDRPGRVLPDGFRPVEAIATNSVRFPVVLTRAGREVGETMVGVHRFVEAASRMRTKLSVIDVVDGLHGFDLDESTPAAQDAVRAAIHQVTTTLHSGTSR